MSRVKHTFGGKLLSRLLSSGTTGQTISGHLARIDFSCRSGMTFRTDESNGMSVNGAGMSADKKSLRRHIQANEVKRAISRIAQMVAIRANIQIKSQKCAMRKAN